MLTSSDLIKKYELKLHPEGGYYKEVYRSSDKVLPSDARYNGENRFAGTSIYFLLPKGNSSGWHSVNSDETWYFNKGDDLILRVINPETKEMSNIILGSKDVKGVFQFTVPAGHIFSAESLGNYTLVSCSVMPGFEFKDFKLFSQAEMSHLQSHPEWPVIKRLIRDQAVDSEIAVREELIPSSTENVSETSDNIGDPKQIISDLIKKYKLEPHPEGGYYKEVYRSSDKVLPSDARYNGENRFAGTSIYFLLPKGNFSGWHSVNSDETWYFNKGDDLILRVINPETKEMSNIILGSKDVKGVFQFTVPAGYIFSAESLGNYTLVSCSVMPGFEFKDFKLFSQAEMSHLQSHPEWPVIKRLIRDQAVDSEIAVREGLVPVESSASHVNTSSPSPSKKENVKGHMSSLFFPYNQSDKAATTAAPNEELTQLVTVLLKNQNLYRAVMEKLIKEEPDYKGLTQQLIDEFSPESSPRSPRNTKGLAF